MYSGADYTCPRAARAAIDRTAGGCANVVPLHLKPRPEFAAYSGAHPCGLCVDRYTSHVFSHAVCTLNYTHTTLHGSRRATQCVCVRASIHLHVIHDVCLSVRWLFLVCLFWFVVLLFLSVVYLFSSTTCTVPGTPSSMSTPPRVKTAALTQNEEYCPMAMYHPLTGYEPKLLDDFDHSETSAMIFQDESGDIDTEPSYSCEAELDGEIIGKALSSPLFLQEREEPANRRQAYHFHEESLFPAHTSTGRLVYELSSCQKRRSSREVENERIRILLERQKKQILADVRTEIQNHEVQTDSDRRSIQELNGIVESQRREIDHTIAGDEQFRRDQLLLQEQLSVQNRDLREAHIKSFCEMEELKRVQELRVDESSRRRLVEDRDTVLELTARIQELQNEVHCMNDSRDFKDAESVRTGLSHVTSQPAIVILAGCSAVFGNAEPQR